MVISLFTLLIMLVAAVGAPWLAPHSSRRMDVAHRLAAPSAAHWFGTDELGRDVLTAQLSLTVGFPVAIASLTCDTVLGVVSATCGGRAPAAQSGLAAVRAWHIRVRLLYRHRGGTILQLPRAASEDGMSVLFITHKPGRGGTDR